MKSESERQASVMKRLEKFSDLIFCVVFYGMLASLFLVDLYTPGRSNEKVVTVMGENHAAAQENNIHQVKSLLTQMTLEEKVYQMFMVYPETLSGVKVSTQAGTRTRDSLARYPVGGIVYAAQNLQNSEQTIQMIGVTQSYAKIPLLIAADEEGGTVTRLMQKLGTHAMTDMYSYRNEEASGAYKNASIIAQDMRRHGFNTNFAPVCDVWSNPENKVIGNRAYSDSYTEAAELIPAAVQGFSQGGIISTLKHFPGHGDTLEDSHEEGAYVYKTLGQMRKEEFLPFIAGIASGADMIMLGHLTVPEIDEVPATISKKLVTDILRNELEFSGVVITDALAMGAMRAYDEAKLCIQAIEAGVDILLAPENLQQAAEAIIAAVRAGQLDEARINESVLRILNMKQRRGIL